MSNPVNFEDRVMLKLEKIEDRQVEHTVQLALNTSVLTEHHRRSTNLERRMEPIEDHTKFMKKLIKLVASIVAGLSAISGIIALLLK